MNEQPTPKQVLAVWSYSGQIGTHRIDARAKAKDGSLTKESASEIIAALHACDMDKAPRLLRILDETWTVNTDKFPAFIAKMNATPKAPKADPEPEPVEDTPEPEDEPKADETTPEERAALKEQFGILTGAIEEFVKREYTTKYQKKIDALGKTITARDAEIARLKERRIEPCDPVTPEYFKPACFDEVAAMLRKKEQVMLYGPRGSGKSRLFKEIAKAHKADYSEFSMAAGIRYQQLICSTEIVNGNTVKVLSKFAEAIQRPGYVVLEECLAMDDDMKTGLNSLLEQDVRTLDTPLGKILAHDDCLILATANGTGRTVPKGYGAAQMTDNSYTGRFFVYGPVPYDVNVEKALLQSHKIAPATIDEAQEKVKRLRDLIRQHDITFDVDTRNVKRMGSLIAAGFTLARAFEIAFLMSLSSTERQKVGM